jgi:hypothetical protein
MENDTGHTRCHDYGVLTAFKFVYGEHSKTRLNPLSTESILQIPLLSLVQTWVHSYAITSRTKQAVYTNFQLWIDKTATLNLTPSGVTSDLTLTVSCVFRPSWPLLIGGRLQEWVENKRSVKFRRFGLGDAGGPIDSRVGDLCNHVGFTDVYSCSERLLAAVWTKKSPDSRLREGATPIFERETSKNWPTFNSLSFALGFESIGPLISALSTKIGS